MRVARLAGGLLAVGLSVSIVATTPSNAEALTGEGTLVRAAVAAGEIVAGGAEAGEAAGAAGLCVGTAGAGCIVEAGIIIGIGLYATHDVWLPTVSGWLNHLSGHNDTTAPNGVSGSGWLIDPQHPELLHVNAQGLYTTGNASTWTFNLYIRAQNNVQCRSTTSGAHYGAGLNHTFQQIDLNTAQTMQGNGTGSGVVAVCDAGDTILPGSSFRVRILHNGSNEALSAIWTVDNGVSLPATTTYTASTTCVDAGGVQHVITATMTGETDGIPIASCQAHGWLPQSVAVVDASTEQNIGSWVAPSSVGFGQCFAGGQLVCTTKVYVGGQSCAGPSALEHCVDWWTYRQDHPDQVECHFGPYVVAITQCKPLIRAYPAVGSTVTVLPVNDGSWWPDTDGDGEPDTQEDGDTDCEADPGAPGCVDTGGDDSGFPVTGTNPDPGDGTSCNASSWGFNPINWVYQPVKCVLVWAFVPDPESWGVSELVDTFKARPPGSLVIGMSGAVVGFADAFTSGAGSCGTLYAPAGEPDKNLSSCTIRDWPGMNALYVLVQVGIVAMTALSAYKMVAGQVSTGGGE